MSPPAKKRKYLAMAGNSNDLNNLKCKICDKTFFNKNEVQQHYQSKQHKIKEEFHNQKCGIYVRGYDSSTKESDLIKYFSQFGNVIWAHFGHDFMLLDFTEASSVQTVLSRGHYFQGRKLFVRQKQPKVQNINLSNAEEDEKAESKIVCTLQTMNNFEKEVEFLQQILQPNWNSVFPKYNSICSDLYTILSGRFPYVEIYPFGSTLTGLSFNNSDVDIFISNVKQPGDDEVDILNEIKKLLVKSKIFANGLVIPGAKIPIVKCVHYKTRIKCDINIKNMLGVCNSKFIHYYLGIHPKVKCVMIVLKYWGRTHKITGQNHLLTNYSLVMLFIFFLQVKYDFPTVESLECNMNGVSFEPNYHEQWNGHFIPNYNFHSEVFEKTSILDIVKQFFQYYEEFSYETDIINPYLGEIIDKSNFKTADDIPYQFSRYQSYISDENNAPLKVDTPMCIQDPFEHCRNISGVITDATLKRFVSFCKLGQTICTESNNKLHKLLTEEPACLKSQEYAFQGESLSMTLHKNANLKYLRTTKDPDKSEDDLWFENVCNFVIMMFQDFLGMTVSEFCPEEDNSKSKNTKNEGQLDIHDKNNQKILQCEAKINMWDARKKTAKQIQINKSAVTLVERETLVTNHLKEIFKNFQSSTSIARFKLTLKDKSGSVDIIIEKMFSYKKSFRSFALFVGSQLPVWFELHEKDLNKAVLETKST